MNTDDLDAIDAALTPPISDVVRASLMIVVPLIAVVFFVVSVTQ